MSKRQRTNTQPARRSKRPIDKKLINVQSNILLNVQQTTDIYPAATFPGTITGLRWEIAYLRSTGATSTGHYKWAIVVCPAGTNPNALSLTNAASLIDPEQGCLAFGSGMTASSGTSGAIFHQGSTKSMRKLKAGDKLVFITVSDSGVNNTAYNGTIQFFYKT